MLYSTRLLVGINRGESLWDCSCNVCVLLFVYIYKSNFDCHFDYSFSMKNSEASAVLLFDGVCNLCNGFVQFIVKRDPEAKIHFTSLQSDVAKSILRKHQLPTEHLHSVVFVQDGIAHTQSSAGLRVLKTLGFPWSLFYLFIIFPKGLRDAVYDWIAVNRYRWFGKQESCMIPDADLSKRFLD